MHFIFLLNAQSQTDIVIKSFDGQPLKDVSVYSNNKLVGKTADDGKFYSSINDTKSITLIKVGYEELVVDSKDFTSEIYLYEIGVKPLKAVQLVQGDPIKTLQKLIEGTKSQNLYSYSKSKSIRNELISDNDTLHYLNNKLFYVIDKGLHIEDRGNIIKNFSSQVIEDVVSNVYELEGTHFELSNKFTQRSVNISWLQPLVELNSTTKEYEFFFSKEGEKLSMTFEPKKNSKKMLYKGHIIYDINDYGIYEIEFESVGTKNYNTYIKAEKETKTSFENYDEYLFLANVKSTTGHYQLLGSEYRILSKIISGDLKNRILKFELSETPINSVLVKTGVPFDLATYDFE